MTGRNALWCISNAIACSSLSVKRGKWRENGKSKLARHLRYCLSINWAIYFFVNFSFSLCTSFGDSIAADNFPVFHHHPANFIIQQSQDSPVHGLSWKHFKDYLPPTQHYLLDIEGMEHFRFECRNVSMGKPSFLFITQFITDLMVMAGKWNFSGVSGREERNPGYDECGGDEKFINTGNFKM